MPSVSPNTAVSPSAALGPRLKVMTAAFLFSTGGLAVKSCQLSSWQVACFRCAVAFVTLVLLLKAARRLPSWRIVAVGVFYAGMINSYVLANKWTTAANAVFLQTTAPLYVLLLSPLLLGERGKLRDVGIMAVLAAGLVMLFADDPVATSIASDPVLGNSVGALAGFFWALTILGLRYLEKGQEGENRGNALTAVVVGNALASLVALPFALPVASSTAVDWLWVVYLGAVQIGLAYVLLTGAMADVPALDASLLLLVDPVFSPVWTFFFLGEVPGPWTLAGAAVVLGAVVVKSVWDARDASDAEVLVE